MMPRRAIPKKAAVAPIHTDMKKRILLLGSTGSIGRNALSVIDALGESWQVVALAAGSNAKDLAEQANRLDVEAVAIADEGAAADLNDALTGSPTPKSFTGTDALVDLVNGVDFDIIISAVVGTGGLSATIRAVELGKHVALANKESLVIAGSVLMGLAQETGAKIIPVDSEHSAIFQAMQAGNREDVEKIYLTASGGPFRTWSPEAMAEITVQEALRHPTWDMGPKITIDSATMMNKALEIVEARWLFDIDPDRIEVVVHPESIVHSLVEFRDGSVIAQLGTPDMRTPIQYALTYPDRVACPSPRLDLFAAGTLTFEKPDPDRFPALRLGHQVAEKGGTCGAVFNAANEVAVEMFRADALSFGDIARFSEKILTEHNFIARPSLEQLLEADAWARQEVAKCTAC